MILSALLVTALIGGGALVNHAAKEAVNDVKNEICETKMQSQELLEKAQRESEHVQELLKNNLSEMNSVKQEIFDKDITSFREVFSNIKNISVEKADLLSDIQLADLELMGFSIENKYEDVNTSLTKKETAANLAIYGGTILALGPIGSVVSIGSHFVGFCKKSDELDIAKGEMEQIKIECEKEKQVAALYRDSARKCKEVTNILKTLRTFLNASTKKVREICNANGNDYNSYNEEEQQVIWTSLNLAAGINKMICTNIVESDGTLNPDAVKQIKSARALKKSVKEREGA